MSKLQPSPEVLRSIDAPRRLSAGTGPAAGLAAGAGLGALLLAGCLSANVGMDESGTIVLSTGASSGETSGDAASSGASGIMTTTEDPEHTTGDSAETASGTGTEGDTSGSETTGTTAIPVACGDGEMQDGEECDEGQANADEGACTKYCKVAVCGDNLVQAGVEVCDDGVNDGSYGVCGVDCKTPAATCGDGMLQGPEQCDDAAAKSGCLPEACVYAKSCKEIRDAFDEVADGVHTIAPKGEKLSVVCDMDADGGGYTFLKLAQPAPVNAKTAETECAKYGMRLLVPRSKVHLAAAVAVAQNEVLAPIGAGAKASLDYLKIFGIYPKVQNMSCPGQPFNSEACQQWTAFGDIFWVTDQAFEGQPGTSTCTQCSMAYYWSGNGILDGFESVSELNPGSKSALIMCEVPDMLPPK